MEITEVRIKLMSDPHERLQAFCSITFSGSFVIRDLKIIQGTRGPFVAMPSRKLTDRCPKCHCKNHLRASFCNQCGSRLHMERAVKDGEGRAKLYADIAHPINSECREQIQRKVVEAFELELIESKKPGYICRYDDFGEDAYATLVDDDFNFELNAAEEQHRKLTEKQPHPSSTKSFRFDTAHQNQQLTSQPAPSTSQQSSGKKFKADEFDESDQLG